MNILLPAGIAIVTGYILSKRSRNRGPTSVPVPNPDPGSAARKHKWQTQFVKKVGDYVFFDVFAPSGMFGPHGKMRVLRYKQLPGDMNSREEVLATPGVPVEITEAARVDFLGE